MNRHEAQVAVSSQTVAVPRAFARSFPSLRPLREPRPMAWQGYGSGSSNRKWSCLSCGLEPRSLGRACAPSALHPLDLPAWLQYPRLVVYPPVSGGLEYPDAAPRALAQLCTPEGPFSQAWRLDPGEIQYLHFRWQPSSHRMDAEHARGSQRGSWELRNRVTSGDWESEGWTEVARKRQRGQIWSTVLHSRRTSPAHCRNEERLCCGQTSSLPK
jgi:hypothetical protein